MKQVMMVTLEIDKGVKFPTIVDWMNEKILGSKVTEISIRNIDLIYDGALNTFLGEMTVVSTDLVSIDELKHIFSRHPHFIHKIKLKSRCC